MKREMTAARREILVLLRRKGPQTAHALADSMRITPVGVRKHLDALEIDGLVAVSTERRPIGRPVQVYALTEAADDLFPKAYESMLEALLRQLKRIGGDDLVQQVLDGRLEEFESTCRERCPASASLADRVDTLARVRDEAGYMVEWERDGDRYVLTEFNCALYRIARQFPQFCKTELELFRRVLGKNAIVERTEHAAAGGQRCIYVIHQRSSVGNDDASYEEQDVSAFLDADAIC